MTDTLESERMGRTNQALQGGGVAVAIVASRAPGR